MLFLPFGGNNEVGMNFILYGFEDGPTTEWIAVDCGTGFPDAMRPGIDKLIPDFSVIEHLDIRALLITHGHEDHIGAIPEFCSRYNVPVYATNYTATLIQTKMREFPNARLNLKAIEPGVPIDIGAFTVEAMRVSHSIPDPVAFILSTASGVYVHSGDFKLDERQVTITSELKARLRELQEGGVEALMCDSTNVFSEGVSKGETEVREGLTDVISACRGRVGVTLFASNLERFKAVAEIAEQCDRQVVLAGRSVIRAAEIGDQFGYFDDLPEFLFARDFASLPRQNCLVVMTGSQGEPRAALTRIARGSDKIYFEKGDQVIFSARAIPGNEKPISYTINSLVCDDVEVITDSDAFVHVSGHPRQGELKQIYDCLKPKKLIAIHGEPRHLAAHVKFALNSGIPQALRVGNGEVVDLNADRLHVVDSFPPKILEKDGHVYLSQSQSVSKIRRTAANVGSVFVSISRQRSKPLAESVEVSVMGVPAQFDEVSIESLVEDAVIGAVASRSGREKGAGSVGDHEIRKTAERAVRLLFDEKWGKVPICRIHVHD